MNDIHLMWSYIEDHPNEDTPKKALADAYQERNTPDDNTIAYALRWCIKYRKWPNYKVRRQSKVGVYYFVRRDDALHFKGQDNSLPHHLFYYQRGETSNELIDELFLFIGKILEELKMELEA